MYITSANGEFYAPINAPYAEELVAANWRVLNATTLFTNEVERVIPFKQYLHPDIKAKMRKTAVQYRASWAEKPPEGFVVPVPEGFAAKDYQAASAHYILQRHSTLLADPPGFGKTFICIAVSNILKARKVLIICPAIAKYNWAENEWPLWNMQKDLRLGVVEGSNWPENCDVIVINYDILDRHKEKLDADKWDLLICDESHRLNNATAKRTVMVFGGKYKKEGIDRIRAGKRIFASGTPLNRPIDLWVMCRECDPEGLGKIKRDFEIKYCQGHNTAYGWDNRGASNLRELGAIMRAKFMIRHDERVLDLPPLLENIFALPPVEVILDGEDDFVRENLEALMGLATELGHDAPSEGEDLTQYYMTIIGKAVVSNLELLGTPAYNVMFTKFAELREKTGLAKVPYVKDYVKEVTDNSRIPVIIFAYHRSVVEELAKEFPQYGVIMGGVSPKKRKELVKDFQEGRIKGILSNIDAGGEAVTLTAGNMVLFAETDWRGTAIEQAKRRIWRLSQTQPCYATHLCAAKSFDITVAQTSMSKVENISEVLD